MQLFTTHFYIFKYNKKGVFHNQIIKNNPIYFITDGIDI